MNNTNYLEELKDLEELNFNLACKLFNKYSLKIEFADNPYEMFCEMGFSDFGYELNDFKSCQEGEF